MYRHVKTLSSVECISEAAMFLQHYGLSYYHFLESTSPNFLSLSKSLPLSLSLFNLSFWFEKEEILVVRS